MMTDSPEVQDEVTPEVEADPTVEEETTEEVITLTKGEIQWVKQHAQQVENGESVKRIAVLKIQADPEAEAEAEAEAETETETSDKTRSPQAKKASRRKRQLILFKK